MSPLALNDVDLLSAERESKRRHTKPVDIARLADGF
jgi:hypothetical protein